MPALLRLPIRQAVPGSPSSPPIYDPGEAPPAYPSPGGLLLGYPANLIVSPGAPMTMPDKFMDIYGGYLSIASISV
jgi:hypothetical protein